jgi:ATP-dependent DNA ligase
MEKAFPEIAGALFGYMPTGTLLDGEVVRWSPSGRLDFAALQRRYANRRRAKTLAVKEPCHFAAFDVIETAKDGDLRSTKLSSTEAAYVPISPCRTDVASVISRR